jgi:hypothetical protein
MNFKKTFTGAVIFAALGTMLGCTSDVQLKRLDTHLAITKMTMEANQKLQDQNSLRVKEVELARLSVQKAEAEAKSAKFGAMLMIGKSAGKEGQAVALALLGASASESAKSSTEPQQIAQPVQFFQVPQMPVEKSTMDEVKEWVGLGLAIVNPTAQVALAMRGFKSNETINRQNNEATTAQQSNVMGAISNVSANGVALGAAGYSALSATNAAGYAALSTTSAAGFNALSTTGVANASASALVGVAQANKPNVVVSGNGNSVAVNGSTATRTDTQNTNNCPNTTSAQSGNSGSSGAATPGTTPAVVTGTPPANSSGASGVTGSPQATSNVNCNAGAQPK